MRNCGGREAASAFSCLIRRWQLRAPQNLDFYCISDAPLKIPIFFEILQPYMVRESSGDETPLGSILAPPTDPQAQHCAPKSPRHSHCCVLVNPWGRAVTLALRAQYITNDLNGMNYGTQYRGFHVEFDSA